MKTLSKISVMVIALFLSNGLFAQVKSVGRVNAHAQATRPVKPDGVNKREEARVNGSVSANAHANETAKSRANSNSVLNDGNNDNKLHREKKHRHMKHHHKHQK